MEQVHTDTVCNTFSLLDPRIKFEARSISLERRYRARFVTQRMISRIIAIW